MTRLMTALVAMVVTVGLVGTATASAQTQVDDDFSGGTPGNTVVFPPGDLALDPNFDISEEFDGMALPTDWEGVPWAAGGTASVAGGVLTVDGARANPTASYEPGRSLDFAATFTADPFQHVGFGEAFEDPPWAMFSTGGGALTVGLYARTAAPGGGPAENTPIAVDPLVQHEYSIEWTPSEVRFFVDGDLVATHANPTTTPMRPIASDFNVGAGSVQVDYLDLYSYPTSGTFTSRVFDAGDSRATWRTLSAALDTPPGSGVTFEVRTGSTPTPDASWTAFQPVGPGGEISGPLGRRYLQYRATLTTTDTSVTPFVESVTLGYEVDTSAPATTIGDVTVSGTTARVTFSSEAGASFECSLDSGPFQACTSPKEYTGLSAGSHRVRVRAIDQVGNVGPAAERSFTIASTVTPADTKAPKVRPKPRSVKVSPNGKFRVRLRCPSDEIRCRIVLRVRYRGKIVARKRVTVDGGDTERVTLRLNRRGRRALQANRRIRVRAITTARDAAGNRGTTRTRMRLRAKVARR
jgi:Glycosyl hydrolases family 16